MSDDVTEEAFWEAVAKTEGTRMASVRFPDSTWHHLVMAGTTVYLDGTILPTGDFAVWDRTLDPDEVARLFPMRSALSRFTVEEEEA